MMMFDDAVWLFGYVIIGRVLFAAYLYVGD